MPELNNEIRIEPARRSADTSCPLRIALVDYRLLGVHEQAHPTKVLHIIQSILRTGYQGPAISVLQQHEDRTYHSLRDGTPARIEPDGYGEFGVADGHNRLAAIATLDKLGFLRSAVIPVQVLPVRDVSMVKIVITGADRETEPLRPGPAILADIEACFRSPEQTITPYATTHFEVRFADGTYDHVHMGQPDIVISRSDFLDGNRDIDALADRAEKLQPHLADRTAGIADTVRRLHQDLSATDSDSAA